VLTIHYTFLATTASSWYTLLDFKLKILVRI